MTSSYQPPYTITPRIVSLIAAISEHLGRIAALNEDQTLSLRRINRIRTVQGSLAIEGNTLSEEQITAILEGKRVVAPPKEIQEARNALNAYEQLENWQPANESNLLDAHRLIMEALADDAGQYRKGNVGVMSGDRVVHMAPPAKRVPKLITELLGWLKSTDQHPLIVSSVFHYEFEFIHPFSDGNGRVGRLWQTLILSKWNSLMAELPVESMVHAYQQKYDQAINTSTQKTDSAPFIEFMLSTILETIQASTTPHVTPHVTPQVKELLNVVRSEVSRDDLQTLLGLTDRKSFRQRYLKPALDAGLIEMTIPEKPKSKLQKYRLTVLGRELADD